MPLPVLSTGNINKCASEGIYHLRFKISKLSGVKHIRACPETTWLNYLPLLTKYRAAVAAASIYTVFKYIECAAAGCLTFMEITDQNGGECLGFQDGVHSIHVNDKTYKDRVREYVNHPNDLHWGKIAQHGREFALSRYTSDIQAARLVDVIRKTIA